MTKEEETNQKKFSNWLQSVQALEDTKASLGQHVLAIWKKQLMKWKRTVGKTAVQIFFECVANDKIKFVKKWKCVCGHKYCATILKDLLRIQQNPGKSVVWNSSLCEKIRNGSFDVQSQQSSQSDGTENIQRLETSKNVCARDAYRDAYRAIIQSFKKEKTNVNFENTFEDCKEKYAWCIANMFMQRGKAKSDIKNTGPDDTDAAMFFRMMKNCKLFELEDENNLYDDILLCRDRLHHSANNRIQREEAESYFNMMTSLLKKFDNVQECKDTIEKINKIRKETIVCISIPDVNIREMAKEILEFKVSALQVDIEIALQVDIEIDKDKIHNEDDLNKLLEETLAEIENTKDPEKPLNSLDHVVEDLSNNDSDFGKRGKHEENVDITTVGTSIVTSPLQPSADKIKPVPDVRLSHLWSVVSKQTYDISLGKERSVCIAGSCLLPSGESLLADSFNRRLKKLDTSYKVIAVCDFAEHPWDVCYIGNNEAVVSMLKNLRFVDVVGMTITRSVNTEHVCARLACHGNLLYVKDNASVYMYSIDDIKQIVLYTSDESDAFLQNSIAVSDDGSKIYILHSKKLTVIDNSGKHLNTFEAQRFHPFKGLFVDGECEVLVCESPSGVRLQISFNGSHRYITASEDKLSTSDVSTLHFDRQRSKLIFGGYSNTLTVLHLDKVLINRVITTGT